MTARAWRISLVVCILASMPMMAQTAPSEAAASSKLPAVFVFADRTDRHAKYSSSEVFHDLLNDVTAFLKESKLSMATDEFGGRSYSENQTPIETIMAIARDNNATSVLHLNVDRPLTKWMKVSVRCYNLDGKLLWEDKAESGGGMSGGHGLKVTKERLREVLKKHLGQDGLPLLTSTAAPAQPAQ